MSLVCTNVFAASTSAVKFLDKDPEWFKSDEAKQIAKNILSFQAENGGWPKNIDTAEKPYTEDPKKLHATYDNKATTDELRYLARMYRATQDKVYLDSFNRGLAYILDSQYENGGWPQEAPPPKKSYPKFITFNDGAMARLMFFVREVYKDDLYSFVDSSQRERAKKEFDRGIDCILKCQVKVDGKLTSWCAQHDEKDFSPQPARNFELASLSGCESIGIVHVLMNVENPSPEVIAAVDGAYEWFVAAKVTGIRIEDRPQANTPKGYERFVVEDPTAPPIWARFYEIGTNKPIFADRDSVKKYSLAEIGSERRTGYKWYGYWPQNFVTREYPEWKAKLSAKK
jgi:PelA/Pel-15E family pectate lyase